MPRPRPSPAPHFEPVRDLPRAAADSEGQRGRSLPRVDGLTGLQNHRVLRAELKAAARATGTGTRFVLMLVDLDGFRLVNDALGHAAGDHCLRTTARRLVKAMPGARLIARTGADEFAVLWQGSEASTEIEFRAGRLLQAIRKPIVWRGHRVDIGASIGMTRWEGNEEAEGSDPLAQARWALDTAKDARRGSFRWFTPDMQGRLHAQASIITSIGAALRGRRLEVHYQPKVQLQSGAPLGFEALVRWRRPDGKLALPAEFTPALEDPELSRRIGEFVIETSMKQAAAWQRGGVPFGHIAVNVSSSQFYQGGFGMMVLDQLNSRGLAPSAIEVEVTEGVLLNEDFELVRSTMFDLKARGVRIALDDFGTGFASLIHLRRFPVDSIKIDRGFVRGLLHQAEDRAIVEAVTHLGRAFKLDVVAEGIELEAERWALEEIGCHVGQGFLFGAAMPPSSVPDWLTTQRETGIRPLWPVPQS